MTSRVRENPPPLYPAPAPPPGPPPARTWKLAQPQAGARTVIWDDSGISDKAVIGEDCRIGRGVIVGPSVQIGNRCKVQDHALLYEGAVIEDQVFIGPGAILTNDRVPRAMGDWDVSGITIRKGASIGAGAIVIAGVEVGERAMVGAGSVVTKNVEPHATVAGNPARFIGWACAGRDCGLDHSA